MNNVRIERDISRDGWSVWFLQYAGKEKTFCGYPTEEGFKWKEVKAFHQLPKPSLTLDEDVLKALVLGLIESGLITDHVTKNDRELKATQEHLKDIQNINRNLFQIVGDKL